MTPEGLFPPGIHEATWPEIVAALATNSRREQLLRGFLAAVLGLKAAGCKRAYLDGSFVTDKERPGDFDACWETNGVNPALLDPVLLNFSPGRLAQKVKYGGELFPSDALADPGSMSTFVEFFQVHKETGLPKGIIAIDLERLQP